MIQARCIGEVHNVNNPEWVPIGVWQLFQNTRMAVAGRGLAARTLGLNDSAYGLAAVFGYAGVQK